MSSDFQEGSPVAVKPTSQKRPSNRGAPARHRSRNSHHGLSRLTGSTLPSGSGSGWSGSTHVSDARESKHRKSVQGQQFLISPTFKIELFFLAQD
jgi:hypothetical protein